MLAACADLVRAMTAWDWCTEVLNDRPIRSVAEQGPEVDPEDPVIDGPAPLTRQDFARDSKPDSNTVKEPLRPIGPATTDGGSESVGA